MLPPHCELIESHSGRVAGSTQVACKPAMAHVCVIAQSQTSQVPLAATRQLTAASAARGCMNSGNLWHVCSVESKLSQWLPGGEIEQGGGRPTLLSQSAVPMFCGLSSVPGSISNHTESPLALLSPSVCADASDRAGSAPPVPGLSGDRDWSQAAAASDAVRSRNRERSMCMGAAPSYKTTPVGLCSAVARAPIWLSPWLCACVRHGESTPEPEPEPEPALIVEAERRDAEPEPEPIPEPVPEASSFEPATRGEGSCIVTIVAVLEAEEYRGGGPMTPSLEASMAADPDFARMYNSESHGDHHIQCHYQVALAHLPGKRWRWREVKSNTLRDLSPEICNSLAVEVADDIIRTTKNCKDFNAGAYWGYVLEPMA
jgi:hypothetical protein